MSADTSPLRLGWIGLGSMGLAMAMNIQSYLDEKDWPPLRFTNRTMSRGMPLADARGVPCNTIADLLASSDAVFISVSNDEALHGVINEIITSGHAKGKIIIDTTTIHPDTSAEVTKQLAAVEASYIAAPVFGATPLAQAGRLLIAVAGPPEAIKQISPYLQGVIARKVIEVGSEPSKALLLKTTSNFITAGLMYLLSEAHVLAEKSGLPASVLEVLIGENFGAYANGVSKRMTQGVYCPAKNEAPYSGLELGMKDVGHGLGIAKEVNMDLKLGEHVMESMQRAKQIGDAKGRAMDSSSIYGVVRQNAGLDFANDVVKKRDAEKEQWDG